MRLQNTACRRRLDVVDDDRRFLAPEARVRDNNRAAVRADLQVLQERPGRRDVFRKALVVNQFSAIEIETQQPWAAKAVISMIDGPQAVEAVYDYPEDRVKQL